MGPDYILSAAAARRFLLRHQWLDGKDHPGGKEGIMAYMRSVRCIQFDPLNIAGHNHELVLQARFADFRPETARSLLYEDRLLLDAWDKNMSIVLTEDWPFFERYRRRAYERYSGNDEVSALVEAVRGELNRRGPLSSLELEWSHKVDWAWAPARASRAVLESMYFWGELAVHRRQNTRRYYDFASRLLPSALLDAPDPNQSDDDYADWYVHRRIGSIGLLWNRSGDGWLGISHLKSGPRTAALARLRTEDRIREVQVEGIGPPLYVRTSDVQVLESAVQEAAEGVPDGHACAVALAPLDNLLWERKLLLQLFGFDYRWEVYKPAALRQYGYYVLPLLYGDRFVARIEPVLDRSTGALNVSGWWWEPGETVRTVPASALAGGLQRLADALDASAIVFNPDVVSACKLREVEKELKKRT